MNFNVLTKEIVEPLLYFWGFSYKKEFNGLLEYDHKILTLIISYDYNRSFEVDVTFTFKVNGMFYDFAEMKEYFYGQKANLTATQITNNETLKVWLESVQKFLKENLPDIINNHVEVCNELEKVRNRRIDNYEKNREDQLLKEGVEKYWTNKDYAGLIKFLESFKVEFELAIKRKYEYAMKVVNKK